MRAVTIFEWCERLCVPWTRPPLTPMVEIARRTVQSTAHRGTSILCCQRARPHRVAMSSSWADDALERLYSITVNGEEHAEVRRQTCG